jgi:putative selenate reductase
MPAQDEELTDLLEEGGRLVELTSPSSLIVTDGRLDRVEMSRMRLGEPDASGRRRPEVAQGADFEVELDTLIVAIGQLPDLSVFGGDDVALNSAGNVDVDSETLETSLTGVYAGGDIIGGGPASIVKAAGDGRKIAEAILARGKADTDENSVPAPGWPVFDSRDLLRRRARTEPRVAIPHRPPADRTGFDEVILTLTPGAAALEAARCLDCDLLCSTCDGVCPNRAILTYTAANDVLELPTFTVREGGLAPGGSVSYRVAQGPQVAVLSDACNECGNCVTFCPTSGRPWLDKPRLYLHREDFDAEDDNAFMLLKHNSVRGIQARFGGELHQLFADGGLRYASPYLEVELDATTLEVRAARLNQVESEHSCFDPDHIGAMITLLRSLTESMPELPVVDAEPDWLL